MDKERDAYWNVIHTVHPGEVFPLFHLTRNGTTIRHSDNGSFGGMASRVRLQTGVLDSLNMSITAAPYALPRAAVVTPFDRNQGYPLDQEDFSLRSRYKKIVSMKHELVAIVEGLGLVVFAAYEDLSLYNRMGAFQGDGLSLPPRQPPSLPPEIAFLLKRVYLTLTFPNGSSFTAKALGDTNRLALLFRTFFPTDTGPLPVGNHVPAELDPLGIEEGFRIFLPFDAEQLQTIHARFLLLPDLE
ncbi:MAG: hypothetical protein ACJ8CB_00535 [Ktedonobacteraceae bacterium]